MRTKLIISYVVLSVMLSYTAFAMKNPAAVYCNSLGYEYKIEKSEKGETGYCILPDGQKVDAWQFLQGNVAQEYNYCTIKGYAQKQVTDPKKCMRFLTVTCLVCILEDGREVEVTELMGLTFAETTCGDGTCGFPENYKTCPQDCPSGTLDDYCDGEKDKKCDPDCSVKEDPDCR